jgi:energy-coupling factor transporter ATP-binding protein EcfA2
MSTNLLALYGLKWNPFSQDIPTHALYIPERMAEFCWRVENVLVREGGFAMVHGDPGTGKSVLLRHLAGRLERMPELLVGTISHPQSQLGDFYREMGDVFCQSAWKTYQGSGEISVEKLPPRRCATIRHFCRSNLG